MSNNNNNNNHHQHQNDLKILKKYDQTIDKIISKSTHAVIYDFDLDSSAWKKSNFEGPLFVVRRCILFEEILSKNDEQKSSQKLKSDRRKMEKKGDLHADGSDVAGSGGDDNDGRDNYGRRHKGYRYTVIVMNRSEPKNFTIDVTDSFQVNSAGTYVMFRNSEQRRIIYGLWFHAEYEKQQFVKVINECMEDVKRKGYSSEDEEENEDEVEEEVDEEGNEEDERSCSELEMHMQCEEEEEEDDDAEEEQEEKKEAQSAKTVLLTPSMLLGVEDTEGVQEEKENPYAEMIEEGGLLNKKQFASVMTLAIQDEDFLSYFHDKYVEFASQSKK